MDITIEDIMNMSDEEVSEMNRKLGIKAVKRFALFTIAKWGFIAGVSYVAIKYVESTIEDVNS